MKYDIIITFDTVKEMKGYYLANNTAGYKVWVKDGLKL